MSGAEVGGWCTEDEVGGVVKLRWVVRTDRSGLDIKLICCCLGHDN